MTKQLDDMWTSKWVLPEHREALVADDRSLKRLIKPDLDEQEVAAIDQAIHSAIQTKGTIILTVFDKYELKRVTGTVFKLDAIIKMVKIKLEDPSAEDNECIWVPLRDILKAEMREVEEWDDVGWE
ncbi:YolD-like family protein [Paenibacillus psychroresistens]|uniref:YolD-like family protein n=1 Tax=Paenibacillus psychroresistens TaxID=1778678 RepID=A0A6B8RKQ2_9BACL|nr:YolD-like family protein [Paenibacillus psychroresistens]QGQ96172.1 YolD-like family protein [Paenibacillus psychroresistens]